MLAYNCGWDNHVSSRLDLILLESCRYQQVAALAAGSSPNFRAYARVGMVKEALISVSVHRQDRPRQLKHTCLAHPAMGGH